MKHCYIRLIISHTFIDITNILRKGSKIRSSLFSQCIKFSCNFTILNKATTLKSSKLDGDLTELIELVVDEIYKLNEIIRSLNSDSAKSIELAQDTQKLEREIDIKYRKMVLKALEITTTSEMLLMKDTIEGIEEMADKCQEVSDSFILLALSL